MGSGSDSIWGQKKLLEPVCCMSNIFSVFQSSSTDSTCRQKKRLEPLLHVKYFQFSIVAVQIQLAGKKTVGTCLLHVKYFQFSTATVQIQPGGKKTVGTCLLHVKYLQFSTVAVQIQLAGKKNCWNLFVACQIFSVFHSSCTDLMCRQKKLLEPVCCMSNIFSFPQQLYRFNLGAKKRLEPLLHVKYFQFSIVAVQIQLAGKKLLEPVCCMSNIFSFPQ